MELKEMLLQGRQGRHRMSKGKEGRNEKKGGIE